MRVSRFPLALLAPISLVVLVVALGALQYSWVGQATEAHRAQLRQSLDFRARDFASDFDREIRRAHSLFRPQPGFSVASPESFAKQYDEWNATAAFSGLIKAAYFAELGEGQYRLHRFDPATRTFEAADWPDALRPVNDRLQAMLPRPVDQSSPRTGMFSIATSSVMPEVPAILIAAPPPAESGELPRVEHRSVTTTLSFMVAMHTSRNHVVLELDREFTTSTLLPALVERHFADSGAHRFRVSVVDSEGRPLVSRGIPDGQTLDVSRADVSTSFFSVPVEVMRFSTDGRGRGGAPPTAAWSATATIQERSMVRRGAEPPPAGTVVLSKPSGSDPMIMLEQHAIGLAGTPLRTATGGWKVHLQHAAGSLDAAVAQARRRNLLLSFGILGVLAASAGLVMINARRSEKLAAQQMEFVATVSHELRTPVAVIRSAAQNLSAGVVQDAGQARQYGELIESEGRRLTDMVEQVLEFAGLSDSRRTPATRQINLAAIARDVVAASASLPESQHVEFDVQIDDHVRPVMADEEAVRRALLNLVGNAVKYGGDGGWIGVTVSRGTGKDDGRVVVAVADRGRGIPADELAHIFDPFCRGRFAVEQQIHGNGLGLSLVKRIVEAHGGRISVKSAPDEGSTFTVSLPAMAAEAAQSQVVPGPPQPASEPRT